MTDAQNLIRCARSWLGTPYHHRGNVKGAGCDCLMLVIEASKEAGLLPKDVTVPEYPEDIMFHQDDTRYVDGLMSYCDEVLEPAPGDVAMWFFGRVFCHGAIVIDWPRIIHAYKRHGKVLEMNVDEDSRLMKRPVRFFRPRGES